ncbi:hypothetical protein LTR93_010762 [Exophiala xenobiotica]|nr:hypothetical protein LTR93_010762 [Exophiala xenobiotica]
MTDRCRNGQPGPEEENPRQAPDEEPERTKTPGPIDAILQKLNRMELRVEEVANRPLSGPPSAREETRDKLMTEERSLQNRRHTSDPDRRDQARTGAPVDLADSVQGRGTMPRLTPQMITIWDLDERPPRFFIDGYHFVAGLYTVGEVLRVLPLLAGDVVEWHGNLPWQKAALLGDANIFDHVAIINEAWNGMNTEMRTRLVIRRDETWPEFVDRAKEVEIPVRLVYEKTTWGTGQNRRSQRTDKGYTTSGWTRGQKRSPGRKPPSPKARIQRPATDGTGMVRKNTTDNEKRTRALRAAGTAGETETVRDRQTRNAHLVEEDDDASPTERGFDAANDEDDMLELQAYQSESSDQES